MTILQQIKSPRAARHRVSRQPAPSAPPSASARAKIHPMRLILLSLLLGLLTGPAELLALFMRRHLLDPSAISAVELNRHALWMLPLSTAILSVTLGSLLAVAAYRVQRRRFTALALCAILFLAVYDLMLLYRGLSSLACSVLSAGIAYNLTGPLIRLAARRPKLLQTSVGLLITLLIALIGADYLRDELTAIPTATARAGEPNVLFIVLDTVRAQSLSLHGYSRETSPNLARYAAQGLNFMAARSAAPWTLPSHATMFTGRWPSELSTRLDNPLDATYPTLAEFLRNHGYVTAGFVANTFFCSRWYGLNRGFLHYEDVAWTPREILSSSYVGRAIMRKFFPSLHDRPTAYFDRNDAPTINAEFKSWLANRPKSHPFFAFLNYYDAHDPFITPPGARSSKPEPAPADLETIRDWHHIKKSQLPPQTIARARDAYEDCVTYLDDELGSLLDSLREDGTLMNTLVVITADHGEEFNEHGQFGHGNNLYDPAIHVPLLIIPPTGRVAARIVNDPVTLRDLPATIVDMVGLANDSPFPGHSLARHGLNPSAPAHAAQTDDVVLSEIVDDNGLESTKSLLTRSLASGPHVYIRHGDGREELFNTVLDPTQSHNTLLNAADASTVEHFRLTMKRLDQEFPPPTSPTNPSAVAQE